MMNMVEGHEMLAERNRQWARAVRILVGDDEDLCRRVWTFLRDPTELVIVMKQYDGRSSIVRIALQSGRLLPRYDLDKRATLLASSILRGPGTLCRLGKAEEKHGEVIVLRWRVHGDLAMPSFPRRRDCPDNAWLGILGGSVTGFLSEGGQRMNGWVAVAAVNNGYIARARLQGGCQAYDIVTGQPLGTCQSSGIAGHKDDRLVMTAYNDFILLVVCNCSRALQHADIIHVTNNEVVRRSTVVLQYPVVAEQIDRFKFSAMGIRACAFNMVGASRIALHWLGSNGPGLDAEPFATLHVEAYDIVLLEDKFITLERGENAEHRALIVRDYERPDSPAFSFSLPWTGSLGGGGIFAGVDLGVDLDGRMTRCDEQDD